MKQFVVLSFDLGIDGDYENMYAWLDDHDARECGKCVAWFHFDNSDEEKSLEQSLKSSLEETVEFSDRSRVYILHRSNAKVKGKFIFGRRKKRAPWTGFGRRGESDEVEDDFEI